MPVTNCELLQIIDKTYCICIIDTNIETDGISERTLVTELSCVIALFFYIKKGVIDHYFVFYL